MKLNKHNNKCLLVSWQLCNNKTPLLPEKKIVSLLMESIISTLWLFVQTNKSKETIDCKMGITHTHLNFSVVSVKSNMDTEPRLQWAAGWQLMM